MRRHMLKSKIHRATVTEANVHYEGSLTLDAHLLHAADIVPYEEVHVWNVTRGTRYRTYAMVGEIGSGVVCANGAAALLTEPGDLVIIATFTTVEDAELEEFHPKLVFVDERNAIKSIKTEELAGPHTIY
jgi:aspartate 1-decarboxylase